MAKTVTGELSYIISAMFKYANGKKRRKTITGVNLKDTDEGSGYTQKAAIQFLQLIGNVCNATLSDFQIQQKKYVTDTTNG